MCGEVHVEPRIAGNLRRQSSHVAQDVYAMGQNPEGAGTCP